MAPSPVGHEEEGDPSSSSSDQEAREPRGASLATELGLSPDDEFDEGSLPEELVEQTGWTGVLSNNAGPSRSPINTPPYISSSSQSDLLPMTEREEQEASSIFAERFKYLICSSGLLEKDYVPGLSSGSEQANGLPSETDNAGKLRKLDTGQALLDEAEDTSTQRSLKDVVEELCRAGWRWDFVAAALAVLIGLSIAAGIKVTFGVLIFAVSQLWRRLPRGLPAQSPLHSEPTDDLERPHFPASQTPQAMALESLEVLLTESRLLDSSIDSSLVLLQPHSESISTFQPLRLALHRLTDSMTDHLATTTSILLNLVDKNELAVLGEMYDIPVVGSFFYSRRKFRNDSDDESPPDGTPTRRVVSKAIGDIPSPRRSSHNYSQSNPLSSPRPSISYRPQIPLSSQLETSQSLPSRPRPSTTHTHHLSLLPAYQSDIDMKILEDKFTSLPPRTPRMSKRSSWTESKDSTRRFSAHERRITENDEEDVSFSSSSSDRASWDRLSQKQTPLYSPSKDRRSSFTGRKVSPLTPRSQAYSALTSGTRRPLNGVSINVLQPSPFPPDLISSTQNGKTPTESKRRSLQNMVYYQSDESRASGSPRQRSLLNESSGLYRTRSMGSNSDTRRNKSRLSTSSTGQMSNSYPPALGYGRRRDSIISIRDPTVPLSPSSSLRSPSPTRLGRSGIGMIPRPSRVVSISPLTLQSLKASCLGIHLKRRRMVCCLLGLKFIRPEDEREDDGRTYWEEVGDAIRELTSWIHDQREALDTVKKAAESESNLIQDLDMIANISSEQQTSHPNWKRMSNISYASSSDPSHIRDYAPKSKDEILNQIEDIRKSLVGSWAILSQVQNSLHSGSEGTGQEDMEKWSKLREELGGMLRAWERGKGVLQSRLVLSALSQSEHDGGKEDGEEDIPGFMRSWTSDDGAEGDLDTSSSTIETDHPIEPPSQAHPQAHASSRFDNRTEDLVPPGAEVLHESYIPAETVQHREKFTREERIRLVREARARALEGQGDVKEKNDGGMASSGMVVEELKGVIGIIRRRKDGLVEPPAPVSLLTPELRRTSPDVIGVDVEPISKTSSREQDGGELSDGAAIYAGPKGNTEEYEKDWRKEFVFPSFGVSSD